MTIIRFATSDDAPAVRDIYAYYVENTAVTFETTVPDSATMRARISASGGKYPFLVCESGNSILGYAYAYRQTSREAYRFSATTAIYVANGSRGKGIGLRLYRCLLDLMTAQKIWTACATLALPNPASIALHAKLGFTEGGAIHRVGYKLGQWHDICFFFKHLHKGEDEPEEIVPASALPPDRRAQILERNQQLSE